jgi:uncharacterized protein YceH (UPF0502 family)
VLAHEEARVLGCLLEKQAATPDAYPLTLNALTTACNQSSNRDPVVHYSPSEVETAVLALKTKGLARVVHPGLGERATKYRHVVGEALGLERDEQAVLCVLLLRGAQTGGELRTRTERLHAFASPADVERVLDRLAARDEPLVARLERAPGQKEARWVQTLEEDPWIGETGSAPAPVAPRADRVAELEARVGALEARLDRLTAALEGLVDL